MFFISPIIPRSSIRAGIPQGYFSKVFKIELGVWARVSLNKKIAPQESCGAI